VTLLGAFITAFLAFCVGLFVWVRITEPPAEPSRVQDWWDVCEGDR
jgi:hypothetical protein